MAKPNHIKGARTNAALILNEVVVQQRSLNTALTHYLPHVDEKDRSFCQQLCYSSLRHYPTLQFIAHQLIKKPFKTKDKDIEQLLILGIMQLRFLNTPDHAAISETVDASKKLKKVWAGGLLNACLRNYLRQQEQIDKKLSANQAALQAHPSWLLHLYQSDWPENWQNILEANNKQPPMMLRVNQQKVSREAYLQQLTSQQITASIIEATTCGILLDQPCDVYKLPGFEEGWVSVQDGSAQLATAILDIKPGQRVLDACAAPGGKTCHILESSPDIDMTAIDISADRLLQIQQNTERLGLHSTLKAADAADTKSWWDGQPFDRILIDAPCTGSGVIRRHPDIKLLRHPEDIDTLASKQQTLLDNLWPLLKADGLMVYTTCSAFKKENEQQIEAFLQRHPEAEEVRLSPTPATPRPFGYQRLPGDDVMDGFYYACLRHK